MLATHDIDPSKTASDDSMVPFHNDASFQNALRSIAEAENQLNSPVRFTIPDSQQIYLLWYFSSDAVNDPLESILEPSQPYLLVTASKETPISSQIGLSNISKSIETVKRIVVGNPVAKTTVFGFPPRLDGKSQELRNSTDKFHKYLPDKWFEPLDIGDARFILSQYILQKFQSSFIQDVPPIFVYSINSLRQPPLKTYLGIQDLNKEESHMVFELKNIGTTLVQCASDNLATVTHALLPVDTDGMMEAIENLLVEDGAFSTSYEILNHSAPNFALPSDELNSVEDSDENLIEGSSCPLQNGCSITMHVTWDLRNKDNINLFWRQKPKIGDHSTEYSSVDNNSWNMCDVLSAPPLESSVMLHIRSSPGSVDPDAHALSRSTREELHRLTKWNHVREGQCSWAEMPSDLNSRSIHAPLTSSKRQKLAPLSERVDDFLDEIKLGGPSSAHLDDTSNVHVIVNGPRKDLDFTEHLWKLIQDAVSYEDLVDSLTAVVEELETGRLAPLIHKQNTTALANLIRDCLKLQRIQTHSSDYEELKTSISSNFDYFLENPLEWVFEIGVFKLSRDYRDLLIGTEVLNWNDISPFLDTSQMPTTQITLLHCVHRIYELYSLLKHNLPLLPFESFRSCLKSAVEFYQTYIPSLVDGSLESDLNGIKNAVLEFELWLPRFSSMTTKLAEGVSRSYEATKHSLLLSSKTTQIPNESRKTWCLQLTKPGSRHSFDVNPKSAVDGLEIEAMECDVATSSAEGIDGSDGIRREKRYSVTFGVAEMMH
ncbi:hypothetical protein BKA69DRAFT_1093755 [Paraphysoderma sedebokerense]|nr:hypothetical protein BKA69DRAFT_1093755 [Paraphysoderma sedebokerense]